MNGVDLLLHAAGFALTLLTLPGSALLLVLSLAGLRMPRLPSALRCSGSIAIVVPAHDEAHGIAATLAGLLDEAQRDGRCEVVVIADNCSDGTAEVARAAGVRVLIREDSRRRGKGFALDFAFARLLAEQHEIFVIIDADSRVNRGFLASVRQHFESGAQAVQARYTVLNADDSFRTRLLALSLGAINVLRPRGRTNLGLSAGILGNGFALHRSVLERVPYRATSVVEDLEYHLLLTAAGIRVAFADRATVRGAMPAAGRGAVTQRARWEGGRLRVARACAPGLVRRILQGNLHCIEPLADLALLPLAYHSLLLLLLLALPGPWWLLGVFGLLVLLLHVVAAACVCRLSPRSLLRALAGVPAYLLWKLTVLPRIVLTSRNDAAWVRTARTSK